jgi:hypothetical protein
VYLTLDKMPSKSSRSRPSAARARPKSSGPSIGELAKVGFGLGLGSMASFVIFAFLGMLFFVPGLLIVLKQRKLPKEERSTGVLVMGYILMFIGAILGLGMGLGLIGGLLMGDV